MLLVEFEDSEMPAGLREHLEGCSECRTYQLRTDQLRKLLAMKSAELPDPGFEARSLAAIRQQIDQLDSRAPLLRLLDVLSEGPVPALRYGVAAAFAALLAAHMMTISNISPMQPMLTDIPETRFISRPVHSQTAFAPIYPSHHSPEPIFQIASNAGPRRVEYGPGPSRMVNFEF
jgi:anti-sigma factor RsiW